MARILAYDNAEGILEVYRILLKDVGGYEISTARNVSSVMELLEKEEFNLLLYDIPHAPIGSGRVFCKEAIDNLEIIHRKYPLLPIIAFSTQPDIWKAEKEFKELGVVKGIRKGFGHKELLEAVDEALKK